MCLLYIEDKGFLDHYDTFTLSPDIARRFSSKNEALTVARQLFKKYNCFIHIFKLTSYDSLWESLVCWWDWHDGIEGIWDDLVNPIRSKWESFKMWRRKRNPELVELDAYRELVGIEKRLQEWPRAKPLLEAALRNYEITGQDDKVREIVRRLREADPLSKCLEAIEKKPKKDVSPEVEELVRRAMELVRNGERASVSNFQRKLGIGYNQAAQIWALLEERGIGTGENL